MIDLKMLRLLVGLCFLLLTTTTYSQQIDSVDVDLDFSIITDSITNTPAGDLEMEISIYPISNAGSIVINVYDEYDNIQGHFIYTIAELNSQGAISGNTITKNLEVYDTSIGYRVQIIVATTSGANLPEIITEYNQQ